MKRRVAVRGIFILDGKLLCAQLKQYKTSISGDFWSVLGGGIEDGEALIPALEREIVEETGIRPVVGSLLYIQQYSSTETENLEFFFNILNPRDYLDVDLAKTTHGSKEIDKLEFIDPATHIVLPEFLKYETYTSLGSVPTKIFNYLSAAR